MKRIFLIGIFIVVLILIFVLFFVIKENSNNISQGKIKEMTKLSINQIQSFCEQISQIQSNKTNICPYCENNIPATMSYSREDKFYKVNGDIRIVYGDKEIQIENKKFSIEFDSKLDIVSFYIDELECINPYNISQEKVEEIEKTVNDKIQNICQESLQTRSNNTPTCPFCEEIQMEISVENNSYRVDGNIKIAWGGRNDQPGNEAFSLYLNSEGKIISFDMDELKCIY